MAQELLIVENLPVSSLAASATFMTEHLDAVREYLFTSHATALVILLPSASPDHDDWRRAIALDLSREHAPKRVNVVSANGSDHASQTLVYLRDAPGVTGQYLQTHE